MPAVAGIVGSGDPELRERQVRTMLRRMMHRDDYSSATCFCPEWGVYGGWVGHPWSSMQTQTENGTQQECVLLLNGECFSPAPVGDAYAARGLASGSPARLARRYRERGAGFVAELNGLFSGLLIDRRHRCALLFNDRFGSERIYYHESDGVTYFASEAKALLAVLAELRDFDEEGVAEFLAYGAIVGERTLFRGVHRLPGASLWTFRPGSPVLKSAYFKPADWASQPQLEPRQYEDRFLETLRDVLPHYFESSCQVGLSLTGGLDTRMIAAGLPPLDRPPICYTYDGPAGRTRDSAIGAAVAAACGLDHYVLRVEADFLAAYGELVDRTVFLSDGCAGALDAHEVYLTRLARKLAPIRLTGNFGSEILRGMSTSGPLNLHADLMASGFRSASQEANRPSRGLNVVTRAAFEEIPSRLFGTVAVARTETTFRSPFLHNDVVALAYQAPDARRRSPEAALRFVTACNPRLAGIPTDRGVVAGSRSVPNLLARGLSAVLFRLDYMHREGLPHWLSRADDLLGVLARSGVIGQHKYLPYRVWFRDALQPHVADVIQGSRRLPFWDNSQLARVAEDHRHGRRNYMKEINAIMTLEAVDRLLLREPTQLVASDPGAGLPSR